MFINDQEFITIKIYYKERNKSYIAYTEQEIKALKDEEKITDEKISKLKCITIQCPQLTWGLHNEIQDSALVDDVSTGQRRWNYKSYKEKKLLKIIKKWDATMKDGEKGEVPAPINPKVIACLAPEIAEAILSAYDQETTLGEEEEKK